MKNCSSVCLDYVGLGQMVSILPWLRWVAGGHRAAGCEKSNSAKKIQPVQLKTLSRSTDGWHAFLLGIILMEYVLLLLFTKSKDIKGLFTYY